MTISKCVKWVHGETYFDLESQSADSAFFTTRDGGDMENDEAGEDDIDHAEKLSSKMNKEFPKFRAFVSTIDEWTYLNIEVR